tara:strand:+ start:1554 stop:2579 length:1026 start_codon:yes stop_codon:yes gene_type:complete
MSKKVSVAVLGSTGYVGIELTKILLKHPNVDIVFLGTENNPNQNLLNFDNSVISKELPLTELNSNFRVNQAETVFLALPHGVSNRYVENLYNKIQIIDLSADFRLDNFETYSSNYGTNHSRPDLIQSFLYGLTEFCKNNLINNKNISVPGCYPTSVLIPLIPLLKKKLISPNNIIIDSKSGYSGAGKKFDTKNIISSSDLNFYNYNTNDHRHICEIKQELEKAATCKVNFSFNPHILPNFRGMMSTIYCDLVNNGDYDHISNCLSNLANENYFIEYFNNEKRLDFFSVQNTNKCVLKIFPHYDNSKIIIVSVIDNLIKGAAGQAVQCFNLSNELSEWLALK